MLANALPVFTKVVEDGAKIEKYFDQGSSTHKPRVPTSHETSIQTHDYQ